MSSNDGDVDWETSFSSSESVALVFTGYWSPYDTKGSNIWTSWLASRETHWLWSQIFWPTQRWDLEAFQRDSIPPIHFGVLRLCRDDMDQTEPREGRRSPQHTHTHTHTRSHSNAFVISVSLVYIHRVFEIWYHTVKRLLPQNDIDWHLSGCLDSSRSRLSLSDKETRLLTGGLIYIYIYKYIYIYVYIYIRIYTYIYIYIYVVFTAVG